jgi:hypothetical protein
MVKPYLSRLRPAEPGLRLRPRPRSRFEPAPTLPIDGPAIGSHRLGVPPALPAEATDVEAELGPDPPGPDLTAQAATAAAPGGQTVPQVRAAAPGPAAPDESHPPAHATAVLPPRSPAPATTPSGATRLGPDPQDPYLAAPAVAATAPAGSAVPPAGAAGPVPARDRTAATPLLRSAAPAAMHADASRQPTSAGNEVDSRLSPAEGTGREHAPAPGSAIPRAASRPVPPVQAPIPGGRGHSGELVRVDATPPGPAPGDRLSEAPRRSVGRTSHAADAGSKGVQEGSAHTDRVQAMARSLGDAGAAARAAATTGPSISPPPALTPMDWGPGWPGSAPMHTDVTVTIGRIEVRAPVADPAPARPQPGGPRQRVPSLSDYLETRTRARGRPR